MEASISISARNLTKRYRDLVAVDGIDLEIYRGECFGFLGPNGAGKTSTMRMIACVSAVTEGELLVEGMDVRRNQRAIKAILGVASQADSLDPDLSVFQNLVAHGRYFNMPRKLLEERLWEALDLFQLRPKARETPDKLSQGMRRRLMIARALLHEPKILVLDEPTTGLDPQSRHMVWEKLKLLKTRGITILITTHHMEEAEYLCDRLVVMDGGRILVGGTPPDLIREHAGDSVLEMPVDHERRPKLMESLALSGVKFEDLGDRVLVYGDPQLISDSDLRLDGKRATPRRANLEDVFLLLTGRGLEEGE